MRMRGLSIILGCLLAGLFSMDLPAQSPHPYLIMDFAEKDFQKAQDLCHQGGFEYLLHRYPFSTYGHYLWNPDFATEGDASVARMVQEAESEGIHLGIYIQADAISVNDAFFSPRYYKQLRPQGEVSLFDDISLEQPDMAIYRTAVLDVPSSLNLLLIDDEMIVYGTMEPASDLMLLHQLKRGAYGTKVAAHRKNTHAYKLADDPGRFVFPDGALKDSVRSHLDRRILAAGISFTEYTFNEGNTLLNEAQRIQNVERWNKEYERLEGKAMMLGWLPIHGSGRVQQSTTIEDVEWMLSKSAAYDAGYGMVVGQAVVRRYGQLGRIMDLACAWNDLRLSGMLSEEQKEAMKDPYQDWHLERDDEGGFWLYPLYVSPRHICRFVEGENGLYVAGPWEWKREEEGSFGLRVYVEGKGEIQNPVVHIGDEELLFPCTVKANQFLVYDFDTVAYITDLEYNTIETVTPVGQALLPEGQTEVRFSCTFANPRLAPKVSLRYLTREEPWLLTE